MNLVSIKKTFCYFFAKDRLSILKSALLSYRSGAKIYLEQTDQYRSNLNNLAFEKERPFLTKIHKWMKNPRIFHEVNGETYKSEPVNLNLLLLACGNLLLNISTPKKGHNFSHPSPLLRSITRKSFVLFLKYSKTSAL